MHIEEIVNIPMLCIPRWHLRIRALTTNDVSCNFHHAASDACCGHVSLHSCLVAALLGWVCRSQCTGDATRRSFLNTSCTCLHLCSFSKTANPGSYCLDRDDWWIAMRRVFEIDREPPRRPWLGANKWRDGLDRYRCAYRRWGKVWSRGGMQMRGRQCSEYRDLFCWQLVKGV